MQAVGSDNGANLMARHRSSSNINLRNTRPSWWHPYPCEWEWERYRERPGEYAGWQMEEENYEEGGAGKNPVQVVAELGGDPGSYQCLSTLCPWFFVSYAELLPSRTRACVPRLLRVGFPLIGYVTLEMLLHISVLTLSTLGPLCG